MLFFFFRVFYGFLGFSKGNIRHSLPTKLVRFSGRNAELLARRQPPTRLQSFGSGGVPKCPKYEKIKFSRVTPELHSESLKSQTCHDTRFFGRQTAAQRCRTASGWSAHKAIPFMAGFSFSPKGAQNVPKPHSGVAGVPF